MRLFKRKSTRVISISGANLKRKAKENEMGKAQQVIFSMVPKLLKKKGLLIVLFLLFIFFTITGFIYWFNKLIILFGL